MATSTSETGSGLMALSNNLADAVERAGQSIVAVSARRNVPSSGVHWTQGVIVTADHAIEREDKISITLPSGKTASASIAGRDPSTDLAVLRLEDSSLPPASLAGQDTAKVGQIVLAVARPGEAGLSASWGALSAVGGPWRTWSGGTIDRLLRPDLTLYPGFSGGPLIDAQGNVLGINTSGLSRSMTLSVPVETVSRVAEQLLTKGRIARGYLGVAMQPVRLPDALKSQLKLDARGGLIVVSLESGGPAEQAGIMVGDILVKIEAQAVTDTDVVQSMMAPERIGKPVNIQLIRAGQLTEKQVTVGERPAGDG